MLRKGMFIGDRYEILDKVGSGGMSDVYKAKCHKLNRYVAIKVLKQEFSEDKNFVSKFKVEAQSAAGLAHPNIVNVFDVGEDNGLHYIVMEFIEGITLKKYIEKKGKLPVKEAVSIAIQVAQGIEAAHNNHIIHRDIKPQNIIISKEGKVKVTDFGIARAASANTINSTAMGSVHYISPEQARGGYIDEKSDIYSLGITLYEMLTGQVPYVGDSTVSIALQHIQGSIPSPKELVPELPISVEKIILKCTQKKPDRRYLKVSSLIADLKRSLVNPDEDFVQLIPATNNSATVMISDDEVSMIRKEAGNDMGEDELSQTGEVGDLGENTETDDDEDEDDLDESNPKMDRIITIGGIAAGVIILSLAIFLFGSFLGWFKSCGSSSSVDETTKAGETTTVEQDTTLDPRYSLVPNLVGMTEDEAQEALNKVELGLRVSDYVKDDLVEKGQIISQTTKSGSAVAKKTTIEVIVSDGPEMFDIPDVVGKTSEDAQAALDALGLEVVIQGQTSDSIETNIVISNSPKAPTQVKKGDTITLIVSKGPEQAIIPSLLGKSVSDARTALESAGLKLGNTTQEANDSYASGQIFYQDYTSGDKVNKGTTVNVKVSTGPQQTTTVKESTTVATTKSYTAKDTIKKSDITMPAGVTDGTLTAKLYILDTDGVESYTPISDFEVKYSAFSSQTLKLVGKEGMKKAMLYIYLDGDTKNPVYSEDVLSLFE